MNIKKWTVFRLTCVYLRTDSKYDDILCDEPGRLEDPVGLKRCVTKYCPFCEDNTTEVRIIISALGREVIRADKRAKLMFDANSKRCEFRKPAIYARRVTGKYTCENPNLADPVFGWSCDIGNCPHMDGALDWRANNSM